MAASAVELPTDPSRSITDDAVDVLVRNLGEGSASTEQVTAAQSQLQSAVVNQRDDLNKLMVENRDTISRHVGEAERMAAQSCDIARAVRSVGQDFDLQNMKGGSGLSEFLTHSAVRASSGKAQSVAATTLAALQEIQTRYAALSQIEDAIWAGRSTDDVVVDALLATEVGDVNSKILMAIMQRLALLRSTVSDQLSKAWLNLFSVSGSGTPTIIARRSVRLQLPTISRSTTSATDRPSSTPPSYTLSDVARSMARLETLSQHLNALHTQLLKELIEPLLNNHDCKVVVESQDDKASLQLVQQAGQTPPEVVKSLKTLLSFVRTSIGFDSPSPEIESFLAHLQQDTFARVLSTLLIPSTPSTTRALPDWLNLIEMCAEWETELSGSRGVLRKFAQEDAGARWVDTFRHARLQTARELSFRRWGDANLVEVELPEDEKTSEVVAEPVPARNTAPKAAVPHTPIPPVPHTPTPPAPVDDDDGWGFDDDQPAATPAPSAAPGPPPVDDDSGWDFDDSAPLPAPEPIKPKRPVREAKRLGKRVASKGRDSPTPAAPSPSPSPPPPPPAPKAAPVPPPVVKPKRRMYRVSSACDTVLTLPTEILMEVDSLKHLTAPSFSNVPDKMRDVLAEEMDFICATTPVAQQLRADYSAGAILQLSNGYLYIASQLGDQPAEWPREAVAQRYKTTGEFLYRSCYESQLVAINLLLDGARHFVETSHDAFFAQAEEAVTAAVSRVESLASDINGVLNEQQYQAFMGSIVESIATRALDDVFALEDITEVESGRIGSLLQRIESLDGLFKTEDGISTTAAHVPHWLKLCYTIQILGANLVDITYLFESGSLVDFKPSELSKLVQALFAESAKRSALLGKIASLG